MAVRTAVLLRARITNTGSVQVVVPPGETWIVKDVTWRNLSGANGKQVDLQITSDAGVVSIADSRVLAAAGLGHLETWCVLDEGDELQAIAAGAQHDVTVHVSGTRLLGVV